MSEVSHPIGVFDSGYGGLTVFRSIVNQLPGYDYIYLGDNARAPYGNRSFETVHQYTLEAVKWFFEMGCPLVVLACNTASAKALRTIQQKDLPLLDATKKVLGVIRPTAEVIGDHTHTRHIGVLGTKGTIQSGSYEIEISKFYPDIHVHSLACPMWVPLIENNEHHSEGADYFVKKYLDELLSKSHDIDAVLLACTHYPLIIDKILQYLPQRIHVVTQGAITANSLEHYLNRHTEIASIISKNNRRHFYTTDDTEDFDAHAAVFFGEKVQSEYAHL